MPLQVVLVVPSFLLWKHVQAAPNTVSVSGVRASELQRNTVVEAGEAQSGTESNCLKYPLLRIPASERERREDCQFKARLS